MFSDMKKIVSFNVADSPQYEKSALQVSLTLYLLCNLLLTYLYFTVAFKIKQQILRI